MAKATPKHEPDDGSVDLDFSEYEETEIKVDSEEDKVEQKEEEKAPEIEVEAAEAAPVEEEDEEHAKVSKNAQKRINRLTKKMREAERREEEAMRYAQGVQQDHARLQARVRTLDHGYLNEYGGRLQAEQVKAQADLKAAMETNNPDGVVAAQTKISQLAVGANEYAKAKNQLESQQAAAPAPAQQPPQPQQTQAAPPTPAPDVKAEKWAEKNSWFGKDDAMTFAAFGLHKRMVEQEGFDPQSDEYYDELDDRLRNEFPQKLNQNGSGKRPVQTVASGSRSTQSRGRSRKVKLSPSQVAIANKLGVPLEEYAKYVKT
jgi:hypothetical protein